MAIGDRSNEWNPELSIKTSYDSYLELQQTADSAGAIAVEATGQAQQNINTVKSESDQAKAEAEQAKQEAIAIQLQAQASIAQANAAKAKAEQAKAEADEKKAEYEMKIAEYNLLTQQLQYQMLNPLG